MLMTSNPLFLLMEPCSRSFWLQQLTPEVTMLQQLGVHPS